MVNTIALRKVIISYLKKLSELDGKVYYNRAPMEKKFPYCVYHLKENGNDYPAQNWTLHVELFDKAQNSDRIDNLADRAINTFDFLNAPNDEILPTFYFYDRDLSNDMDKGLQIIDLHFDVNNYGRDD